MDKVEHNRHYSRIGLGEPGSKSIARRGEAGLGSFAGTLENFFYAFIRVTLPPTVPVEVLYNIDYVI